MGPQSLCHFTGILVILFLKHVCVLNSGPIGVDVMLSHLYIPGYTCLDIHSFTLLIYAPLVVYSDSDCFFFYSSM